MGHRDDQRSVEDAHRRIDFLEGVLLRTTVAVAVVATGLGILIPYVTASVDNRMVTASILTIGFKALGERNAEGDADPVGIFLGICYLVLSAVAVATIAVLLRAWRRESAPTMGRWAAALGWLLVLGTAGAWLVMLIGLGNDSAWEMHAGVVVLSLGAVAAALVTVAPTGRALWVRTE